MVKLGPVLPHSVSEISNKNPRISLQQGMRLGGMPSVSICRSWWWAVVVVIVCLVLLPSFTVAQIYTSSLAGKVRDASGAAMPGAKVSVENEGTNLVEERATNDSRFCSYPTLLPGTYTLTVSAKGFATWVH